MSPKTIPIAPSVSLTRPPRGGWPGAGSRTSGAVAAAVVSLILFLVLPERSACRNKAQGRPSVPPGTGGGLRYARTRRTASPSGAEGHPAPERTRFASGEVRRMDQGIAGGAHDHARIDAAREEGPAAIGHVVAVVREELVQIGARIPGPQCELAVPVPGIAGEIIMSVARHLVEEDGVVAVDRAAGVERVVVKIEPEPSEVAADVAAADQRVERRQDVRTQLADDVAVQRRLQHRMVGGVTAGRAQLDSAGARGDVVDLVVDHVDVVIGVADSGCLEPDDDSAAIARRSRARAADAGRADRVAGDIALDGAAIERVSGIEGVADG